MRFWTIILTVGLSLFVFLTCGPAFSQGAPEAKKEAEPKAKNDVCNQKPPELAGMEKLKQQQLDVERSRKELEESRSKLRKDELDLRQTMRNQRIDQQIVQLQEQAKRLEQQILQLEQRKLELTHKMLRLEQQKLR